MIVYNIYLIYDIYIKILSSIYIINEYLLVIESEWFCL